jgi:hypothetical protein
MDLTMTSHYENLPIYKAAADVYKSIHNIVRGFERYNKYTIGAKLRDLAFDVAALVVLASRREDRDLHLNQLCERVEQLKLLVNLGKEVEAFHSLNQYFELMKQVVNLARQAEGWRRAHGRSAGPGPGAAPASGRA